MKRKNTTHDKHQPALSKEWANDIGGCQQSGHSVLTTFSFGASPDLNAIAAQIRQSQKNSTSRTNGRELVVDNRGQVNFRDAADKDRPLTVLSQETFASSMLSRLTGSGMTRSQKSARLPNSIEQRRRAEEEAVTKALPAGTYPASDGQFSGWVYEVTNEFSDLYRFFVYFDPAAALYRVALMYPQLAGQLGSHDAHLFSDGRVCLNDQSGCKDIASAYARSALWCRGVSMVRRGHNFQFNAGQDQ